MLRRWAPRPRGRRRAALARTPAAVDGSRSRRSPACSPACSRRSCSATSSAIRWSGATSSRATSSSGARSSAGSSRRAGAATCPIDDRGRPSCAARGRRAARARRRRSPRSPSRRCSCYYGVRIAARNSDVDTTSLVLHDGRRLRDRSGRGRRRRLPRARGRARRVARCSRSPGVRRDDRADARHPRGVVRLAVRRPDDLCGDGARRLRVPGARRHPRHRHPAEGRDGGELVSAARRAVVHPHGQPDELGRASATASSISRRRSSAGCAAACARRTSSAR